MEGHVDLGVTQVVGALGSGLLTLWRHLDRNVYLEMVEEKRCGMTGFVRVVEVFLALRRLRLAAYYRQDCGKVALVKFWKWEDSGSKQAVLYVTYLQL